MKMNQPVTFHEISDDLFQIRICHQTADRSASLKILAMIYNLQERGPA